MFSFSVELQNLDYVQRIALVQERMKAIQKKYLELKAEVTYLDRKKRKARRREREGMTKMFVLCCQPQIVYTLHIFLQLRKPLHYSSNSKSRNHQQQQQHHSQHSPPYNATNSRLMFLSPCSLFYSEVHNFL